MRVHGSRAGFTLIELSVALAIAVVVTGIVVVRVEGWSSRQELRNSARALGNVIRTYREKAQFEERPYLLVLDPEAGTYGVRVPAEGPWPSREEEIRKGRLGPGRSFKKITIGGIEAKETVTLLFGTRGILPETQIVVRNTQDEEIRLVVGALTNEVTYAEKS
jgi:prepilin-type N-terminal cleavage/methylation domain-containing protein